MISSEVQRTLVKSPPELWAELSDPEALSRHLGELGEIRITRSEPEKRIEWEAEGTSGSVLIKPSGWGTKVTLSVTREMGLTELDPAAKENGHAPGGESEPGSPEPEASMPEIIADPTPPTVSLTAEPVALEESVAEAPVAEVTSSHELELPEIAPQLTVAEPRRGFLSRLFGRRKTRPASEAGVPTELTGANVEEDPPDPVDVEETVGETPALEPPSSSAIESLQARFQPAEPEPAAEALPEPAAEDPPEPTEERPPETVTETPDLAAELKAAEEVAEEEITAVLTAALDRLGAAHHRPFSRA